MNAKWQLKNSCLKFIIILPSYLCLMFSRFHFYFPMLSEKCINSFENELKKQCNSLKLIARSENALQNRKYLLSVKYPLVYYFSSQILSLSRTGNKTKAIIHVQESIFQCRYKMSFKFPCRYLNGDLEKSTWSKIVIVGRRIDLEKMIISNLMRPASWIFSYQICVSILTLAKTIFSRSAMIMISPVRSSPYKLVLTNKILPRREFSYFQLKYIF